MLWFRKLYVSLSFILFLTGQSVAQTEVESETNVRTLDKLFSIQQFEAAVYRYACQVEDLEDSEFFVTPQPCLVSNFTEDDCLNQKCCFFEQEGNISMCVRGQSEEYIFSKVGDLQLIPVENENNNSSNKKQATNNNLQNAINFFVQCVAAQAQNCLGIVTQVIPIEDLVEIINNATNGDEESILALSGLRNFQSVASTLLMNGQITTAQFQSLINNVLNTNTSPVSPLPLLPLPTQQPACFWYPWGAWSNCQGVCGVGIISRVRRCQGCVPGTGACTGNCVQKRSCANPIGQICGYWSGWGPWGVCSTSCGLGQRVRTRECYGGSPNEEGCLGVTSESIICNDGENNSGELRPWTGWTVCSTTCGTGSRSRQRFHTCFDNLNEFQNQDCFNPLPDFRPWTTCSTTCGQGFRTRTRSDICGPRPLDETQTEICNLGFGNWGDWSPWSMCSISCPGGISTRMRLDSCNRNETELMNCGGPGFLTQWAVSVPCSSSCPGGVIVFSRRDTCTNEVFERRDSCGMMQDDGPWSPFSDCSTTCRGMARRTRSNPCVPGFQSDEIPCGSDEIFLPWSMWSMCSQSCAGGTRTRFRSNPCRNVNERDVGSCGSSGSWGEYSEWSMCSTSCGRGSRSRTRIHSCPNTLPNGNGIDTQTQVCNLGPCCIFSEWSDYSECSETCNYGTQIRRRTNTCEEDIAPGIREEERYCYIEFGEWTTWSAWGVCSDIRCNGLQTRTRSDTCTGVIETQTQNCGNVISYTEWSEYTACSASCGGGTQERIRRNICDGADESLIMDQLRQSRICNTDQGVFLPWFPWSTCSSTCGGERRRRSEQTCTGEVRIQREVCGSDGNWEQWGDWSACTQTCFGGTRRRDRGHQCNSEVEVDQEACGSQGFFLSWAQWSACSQSCAGGSQSRSRVQTCRSQPDIEVRPCGQPPSVRNWEFWSGCSVTCGGGIQNRIRRGICGGRDDTETRGCSENDCCFVLPWQEWSACSATCFTGQQNRVRYSTCSRDLPVDTEIQSCNAGSGFLFDWVQWSPCSRSCNGGQRSRTRSNSCQDRPISDEEECNSFRCAFWSDWGSWSACSVSCFLGSRRRTRTCNFGVAGVDCPGESGETVECNAGNGFYTPWSQFSPCSATCGGGTQTRFQTSTCGLPNIVEQVACNTDPGVFGSWGQWSACSRSCFNGMRMRSRFQSCTGAENDETEPCFNVFDDVVGAWGPCSRSCGGGFRNRVITNPCNEDRFDSEPCNTDPGSFVAIGSWSGCSATCGGGTRTLTFRQSCTGLLRTDEQSCNSRNCAYWSGWSPWGGCSVSCGRGERTRIRLCQAFVNSMSECPGEGFQIQNCSSGQLDAPSWSEFSACSRSCGGGIQTRLNDNPCFPIVSDERPCNTDRGNWGAWTVFSCTVTCGGGTQARRRTQSCTGEIEEEISACNTDPGFFSDWSTWSNCSEPCNFGFQTRSRLQSCSLFVELMNQTCFLGPCAIWRGWSNWGGCTTTCGDGISTRTRQCENGDPGDGFCFISVIGATDSRFCNEGPCTDCGFGWSGWSACCRRNPTTLQFRYARYCNGTFDLQDRSCPPGIPVSALMCTNIRALFEEADRYTEDELGRLVPRRFRVEEV